MLAIKTRFKLSHKIIIQKPKIRSAIEMLNWCYQNTNLFYSSFGYDDVEYLYETEIICFENPDDALSFKLTFIGL